MTVSLINYTHNGVNLPRITFLQLIQKKAKGKDLQKKNLKFLRSVPKHQNLKRETILVRLQGNNVTWVLSLSCLGFSVKLFNFAGFSLRIKEENGINQDELI